MADYPASGEGTDARMTPDLIAQVEAALGAARPGPWRHEDGPGEDLHFGTMRYQTIYDANERGFIAVATPDHDTFEFIAHAPEWLAALVAEVKRLRGAA